MAAVFCALKCSGQKNYTLHVCQEKRGGSSDPVGLFEIPAKYIVCTVHKVNIIIKEYFA